MPIALLKACECCYQSTQHYGHKETGYMFCLKNDEA